MKKFLAIILGAFFVLGMVASAFAIHAEIPAETQAVVAKGATQITLGGYFRTRAWWANNTDGQLFNTGVGMLPADDTGSGSATRYDQRYRIYLTGDVTPNVKGYMALEANWTWGPGALGNEMGDNPDAIEAWIQYTGSGLLGVPAGIKVGHMPLALGHQTFFQHTTNGDDAIVIFADPSDALHIAALTIKLSEGNVADNTDDLDAYVGLMTYKMSGHTFGANYTYLNNSDGDFAFSNIGVHAEGTVAGFGYMGEANFQFGDINDDIDAKAWSLLLGANYKVNPVNLRASFGYGSGDDDPGDSDNEEFQTFLSPVEHLSNAVAFEYHVAATAMNQVSGWMGSRTGLANVTFYNVGLDYSPTKDLKTRLDGYIFRASEVVDGSKNAGWEVDAGFIYSIARNLKYYFDVGYFDAGDFYEDSRGVNDPEAVTLVRQQLILSF